ncbi:MAG TPA: IclR family transcriptional regulator [Candidatus Methylomirabilis sp.]|nr:IclR family transcriptional regulator [Candidatus Methylomirabilis sp.]
MRPRTHERGGTVQSVERALTLLEALGDCRGEVGIANLSKRVGLHVSTVHRILGTLLERGYARQNPETGRYALGAKTFHLAESYLGQMDLRRLVRPALERLSRETEETANLVILDGGEALYLDKVESPQNLRIFSRIGHRVPLHCSAVGKVLLASRAQKEVEALLGRRPLESLTRSTISCRIQLRRELEKVREQGFALDCEECEEGACCIAVPLKDAQGRVEASLSVSGPSVRLTPKRMEELIPLMRQVAHEVSSQLGCNSPEG